MIAINLPDFYLWINKLMQFNWFFLPIILIMYGGDELNLTLQNTIPVPKLPTSHNCIWSSETIRTYCSPYKVVVNFETSFFGIIFT